MTKSSVVIDFEVLPADGPGAPAAVLVTDQYSDLGVTFNAPVGLDYSRGSGSIPGFAHSGTKAIEPCYGGEFCTTPIEMTFSAPQRRVKAWVGDRRGLDSPHEVVLIAFDAAGAEIARATATLGASSGPQPIRVPLEVRAPVVIGPLTGIDPGGGVRGPGGVIARAVLRFASPSALTGGLAVDDVEFDTAAVATCASGRDPLVTLDAPADGSTTQTNQVILSGRIDAEAPLDQVIASAFGPSGTRTIDLLASGAVGRGGGPFAFVRLTGLLLPGFNTLTLSAGDCHGAGSAGAGVTFAPFDSGTRIALEHIEVTQSVQDEHNGLPLIAGKRTLARAYLRTSAGTPVIDNVRGTLTACRPLTEGAPICGDFLPKLYAADSITVTDSSDLAAQRNDPNGSLNFELPPEWSSAGLLHLQIADLEIDGLPADVPCDGCDNPNVFGFPGFHQFKTTKPLSFLLFEVEYEEAGFDYAPPFDDVVHLRSWLQRAYPTSRVIAPNISFNAGFDSLPSADWVDVHLYLHKLATRSYNALFGWFGGKVSDSGVYYGLIWDGGVVDAQNNRVYFVRGKSNDTFGVGAGPTGDPAGTTYDWDTDGTYGDWYGGHEIGHLHGRVHPGFVVGDDGAQCVVGVQDDSGVDGDFPYANGSTGQPGWDAGDASLGIPAQIVSPYTSSNVNGSTDVMTYCNYQWMSDYTYRAILHRIDSGAAFATLTGGTPGTAGDALVVTGTLNLTRETVELAPFLRLADVPTDPRPPSSPFSIDLLDGVGALLARYPFEPAPSTDVPPGADRIAVIGEAVPFDPATRTIAIAKDGAALAARSVSANAPSVRLLSPNGGETLGGPTALVTWRGEDVDGDALRYALLYSTDAGTTWFAVAVDLAAESAIIQLDDLPGGTQVQLRVIVSDGVNTGMDDSDGLLIVPLKAPEVRIVAPAVAGPLSTRQTVVFAGDAFDREDGDLDGEALRWTSDRQGALGAGRSIAVDGLLPGHHLVTLAATDSDGLTGAAELVIDVVADLPQAVVAAARIAPRGTQVELDAGGSYGAGGLTYRWAVAARPDDSDAHLLATDGAATALETDVPGVYEIELIVRDALGSVSVARVAITAVARGDCNGDLRIDAADLAALAAELFDGDGPDAGVASGGAFAGNPVGCDANADAFITAADFASMGALLVQ